MVAEVDLEAVVGGLVSAGRSGAGAQALVRTRTRSNSPRRVGSPSGAEPVLLPLGPLFPEVEVAGVQVGAFKRPHAPPESASAQRGLVRGESPSPTWARRGTRSPRSRVRVGGGGGGVVSATQ